MNKDMTDKWENIASMEMVEVLKETWQNSESDAYLWAQRSRLQAVDRFLLQTGVDEFFFHCPSLSQPAGN